MDEGAWPAVATESRPWDREPDRGESRRAQLRARGPYSASVPAPIARLGMPALSAETLVDAEDALSELSRFDAECGVIAAPFSAILLRSESASSSEIEQLTAQPRAIALAELGASSGPNAKLVVANTRAMEAAIALSGELDAAAVIAMQHALLGDTHPHFTGAWRQQQVWVGGGASNSPHAATFVPPHHERVPELMDDVLRFARRIDLPALPQIAIAHAQFETIHPFPDGNGRTGRALVHAMLHRLGITRNVTVPVSAGLLQDTRGYFEALTAYRRGDVEAIVSAFSQAIGSAIGNGRLLVEALQQFQARSESATSARRGSGAWRTIELMLRHPVINAQTAAGELGITVQNAQLGIERLVADGILQPTDNARRNRSYEAGAVLAALDDFAERARRRRH